MYARKIALLVAITTFASWPNAVVAATSAHARELARATSERKLYVADENNDAVDLFSLGTSPKLVGTIKTGINVPVDVAVDAAGTLYVANVGSAHPSTVTEYAVGTSTPAVTLTLGDFHPIYLAVGPTGTVYVSGHNRYAHYFVLEFDAGATRVSRSIALPYSFPYPGVYTGLAVNKLDELYLNEGSSNAGGGFQIAVYQTKTVQSFKSFFLYGSGYPSGGVAILHDRIFVGDPQDGAIRITSLPVPARPDVRALPTEDAGDYLTIDPGSNILYAVSYRTGTLQLYDLHSGKFLGFMHGFRRGVAVDPAGP